MGARARTILLIALGTALVVVSGLLVYEVSRVQELGDEVDALGEMKKSETVSLQAKLSSAEEALDYWRTYATETTQEASSLEERMTFLTDRNATLEELLAGYSTVVLELRLDLFGIDHPLDVSDGVTFSELMKTVRTVEAAWPYLSDAQQLALYHDLVDATDDEVFSSNERYRFDNAREFLLVTFPPEQSP